MSLSSCCGFGRKSRRDDDTAPLLPRYEDDTTLQRALHQKLHTYQMFRALSKGYMPSTEQTIINLRTLLASDLLNANNKDLTESGRLLIRNCRNWLKIFIELLRNKNDKDQIQDLIWYLTKSRISVDVRDIAHNASRMKARADAQATYDSFRTVGSLLLTNSDFRLFMNDLSKIGKQILSDTAFSVSQAAEATGKQLELSSEEEQTLKGAGADEGSLPTKQDLQEGAQDTAQIVGSEVVKVGQDVVQSTKEQFTGERQETLLHRLKQTIFNLRKRTDYNESVSTIAKLIQRYAAAYSRVAEAAIKTAQDDVYTNPALDRAVRNFWDLLSSFGDKSAWEELEKDFNKLFEHSRSDPQFEKFMNIVGNEVQKMLTDPDFFDHASEHLDRLKKESEKMGNETSFKDDFSKFLLQAQVTLNGAAQDKEVQSLMHETMKIYDNISPPNTIANSDLITDGLNIFLPLLIRTIQYIPIPRLEVSVPDMDLLLENLILEPGRTVNHTSFLPYRLFISTKNDLEVRKTHSRRTASKVKSLMTVTINGLSVGARDLGFWIRTHAGIFRFADEGIVSFFLDERGIDISLDVEVGRDRLEQILTLRGVRVHIHKLDYEVRRSKLSWISWLFKPFLKHMLRRSLEKAIAENIAEFLHFANRELVFARERLRATRIADPQDLLTFFKAISARLSPGNDPDIYSRLGVDAPQRGVFKNVYAPGSIVKVWHEEALQAEERLEENEDLTGGWRNDIFDVNVL